jgi:hypothetical protein
LSVSALKKIHARRQKPVDASTTLVVLSFIGVSRDSGVVLFARHRVALTLDRLGDQDR